MPLIFLFIEKPLIDEIGWVSVFEQYTTPHLSYNWYFWSLSFSNWIIWEHCLALILTQIFHPLPFYKWFICKSTSLKRKEKTSRIQWDTKLILWSEIQVGEGKQLISLDICSKTALVMGLLLGLFHSIHEMPHLLSRMAGPLSELLSPWSKIDITCVKWIQQSHTN